MFTRFTAYFQLIVAVEEEEVERLDGLYERALENGCTVEMIGQEKIKEIEPYCTVNLLRPFDVNEQRSSK